MCKKCEELGLKTARTEMETSRKLIEEFVEHYQSMFQHHDDGVVITGLLSLLRLRLEKNPASMKKT